MRSVRHATLAMLPVIALIGCTGGDSKPDQTTSGVARIYDKAYTEFETAPVAEIAEICERVRASDKSVIDYAADLERYQPVDGLEQHAQVAIEYGVTMDEYNVTTAQATIDFCSQ